MENKGVTGVLVLPYGVHAASCCTARDVQMRWPSVRYSWQVTTASVHVDHPGLSPAGSRGPRDAYWRQHWRTRIQFRVNVVCVAGSSLLTESPAGGRQLPGTGSLTALAVR